MKRLLLLTPFALAGCMLKASLPPPTPADHVVDTLMTTQIPVITHAWNELRQAKGLQYSSPVNTSPTSAPVNLTNRPS